MIDFVKVGIKISEYRKKENLTQDDIALKLFVSRQLVSKWENGTGIPSIDVLLELCKLFHTTFEDLLCLDEKLQIDEEDIFKGQRRLFVVQGIINGDIIVNIPNVFYQFSAIERMMVLKAIKEGSLEVNESELIPKLTPGEQAFLRKDELV